MSPLILIYLLMIDIIYMLLTMAILPLALTIQLLSGNKFKLTKHYDTLMENTLQCSFAMTKMDVLGFRR